MHWKKMEKISNYNFLKVNKFQVQEQKKLETPRPPAWLGLTCQLPKSRSGF